MKTATAGYLYGLVQNNAILVMGFSLNESVEKHLPIGYKDLGSIQWSNDGNFNQPMVWNMESNVQSTFNLIQHIYEIESIKCTHFRKLMLFN